MHYIRKYVPVVLEDKQLKDFESKIKKYKRLIYWLISNYGNIQDSFDQDDFFQEATYDLYKAWNKYRYIEGGTFEAWMAAVVKFSIRNYKKVYFRIQSRTSYTDDLINFYDIPDNEIDYSNDLILADAINKLNGKEKTAIEHYLNGENLRTKSLETGKGHSYYSSRVDAATNQIRWSIYGKPKRKATLNKGGRPIYQLSMDGKVLNKYPSAREAGRAGFNDKNIDQVLRGKRKSCGGFIWKYAGY